MDSTEIIIKREDLSSCSSTTPNTPSNTTTTITSTSTNTLDIDPTTFKSTLPPRKRAKTQEEKEQRKIERILRNRRAAHASREKKRKHVEYLENYVLKLEENLTKLTNNYNCVFNLLSQDQQSSLVASNLELLEDVSELKDQIHSNLNGSRKSNKKLKDLDDEQDDQDDEHHHQQQQQQQEEEEHEEEEDEEEEEKPVSKKRKLESIINTPPPSLSSMTPMTSTTNHTSPASPEIMLKKEKFHDENIMYITKHEPHQYQHPHHHHQQQQQQQPLDEVYNLKTDIEDTFWNYPSPLSFHDSPLQLDMESSSTGPTTNHSIADLATISLASRANRIVSVGL